MFLERWASMICGISSRRKRAARISPLCSLQSLSARLCTSNGVCGLSFPGSDFHSLQAFGGAAIALCCSRSDHIELIAPDLCLNAIGRVGLPLRPIRCFRLIGNGINAKSPLSRKRAFDGCMVWKKFGHGRMIWPATFILCLARVQDRRRSGGTTTAR